MINWEEQWACFAPGFINGKAHIELPNKEKLQLQPGPGFGDYSHPTTRLMITLMAKYVSNQILFDIGCGSGILSVAGAKMGAEKVYACDIDADAVTHTRENGELNAVAIDMTPPEFFSKKPIVLMNMIASEQQLAWSAHRCHFEMLITSGILVSDKNNYLKFAKANGWTPVNELESEGWLGFIFKENTTS